MPFMPLEAVTTSAPSATLAGMGPTPTTDARTESVDAPPGGGDRLAEFLDRVAAGRADAPLAPLTIICPSRLAGVRVRRRLVERVPIVGVRCETLPRLAELYAGASLAAEGRTPLSPVAERLLIAQVARQTDGALRAIMDTAGYPRALRRSFARLRFAGLQGGEAAPTDRIEHGHLAEVMRLFGIYRRLIAGRYDADDLLDRAADVITANPRVADELGPLVALPAPAYSAAARRFIDALSATAGGLQSVPHSTPGPTHRLILAPDPESQAREVARHLLELLAAGLPVHELAVLHGTSAGSAEAVRRSLDAAGLPVTTIPGPPLSHTAAGAALLMVIDVFETDLSADRLAILLAEAPLAARIPTTQGAVVPDGPDWARWARLCGAREGGTAWRAALAALRVDLVGADDEAGVHDDAVYAVDRLVSAIDELDRRRAALEGAATADETCTMLAGLLRDYIDPAAPGYDAVAESIEALRTAEPLEDLAGTVLVGQMRAELDTHTLREGRSGGGILLTPYTNAGSVRVAHAVVCDVIDGQFPATPAEDPLIADAGWESLAERFPRTPTAAGRQAEARGRAREALCCGTATTIALPLNDHSGGALYPARAAVEAAAQHEPSIDSAEGLRRQPEAPWCRRPASPLGSQLSGPPLDRPEQSLRRVVVDRHEGRRSHDPQVVRARRLRTLRDAGAAGDLTAAPPPLEHISPSRIQRYAGCGLRGFLEDVLELRPAPSPPSPDGIDPMTRGAQVRNLLAVVGTLPEPTGGWTRGQVAAALAAHLEHTRNRHLLGPPVLAAMASARLVRLIASAATEIDHRHRASRGAAPLVDRMTARLTTPAGHRIALSPYRVDRADDGALWVIEPTTAQVPSASADPLREGRRLATALGVAALRSEHPTVSARIWRIRPEEVSDHPHPAAQPGQIDRALRVADAAIDGMRRGSFPPIGFDTKECARCPWRDACPPRERRDREGAAATAWGRVAEAAEGTQ